MTLDPGPTVVPSANVAVVVARILAREGPPADVGDGMGMTYWGQTSAWLTTYGLPVPTSAAQAATNYVRQFVMTGLNIVCDLSVGLGDCVADTAVNEGAVEGIKFLQRPLGVPADGDIGSETIAALKAVTNLRVLWAAVLAEEVESYFEILTVHPDDLTFADGWGNRMGDKIRRFA